jgi:hypothetical protein
LRRKSRGEVSNAAFWLAVVISFFHLLGGSKKNSEENSEE